ncbi:hypothetical protein VNO77_24765 [Canavalia gladiata]|uniref:Uncharacterized protein n=1 Tax=Canavalia gladiata TaxID=3824 RepID=A0AAN9L6Y6_CANGL
MTSSTGEDFHMSSVNTQPTLHLCSFRPPNNHYTALETLRLPCRCCYHNKNNAYGSTVPSALVDHPVTSNKSQIQAHPEIRWAGFIEDHRKSVLLGIMVIEKHPSDFFSTAHRRDEFTQVDEKWITS